MLSVDSDQHYLYLGMADLVTFTVNGYVTDSGVRVGNDTFRSWPMPGGKPGLFSLFAFPWNMPLSTVPVVFATNPTGAEATGRMVTIFPPKEQPKYRGVRHLVVDDKFVQAVNELDPSGSGELDRPLREDQSRHAQGQQQDVVRPPAGRPSRASCGRSLSCRSIIRRSSRASPT